MSNNLAANGKTPLHVYARAKKNTTYTFGDQAPKKTPSVVKFRSIFLWRTILKLGNPKINNKNFNKANLLCY